MKRTLLLLVSLVISTATVWAQVGRIAHVTSASGGFQTDLNLANLGNASLQVALTAYDVNGNFVTTVTPSLAAGATLFQDSQSLFGSDQVGYVTYTPQADLSISAVYRLAADSNATPAHVPADQTTSTGWRIYPGNPSQAWDGFAVVNTGSATTDVRVRQFDAAGSMLTETTAVSGLAANAKGLYVIGDAFTPRADSWFEISADQPLAMTALRGNFSATLLWQNAAEAVTPRTVNPTACNPENSVQLGAFFIGHSLVGWDFPFILEEMAKDAGHQHTQNLSFIIGAPLKWIWDRGDEAHGSNFNVELPSGNYDHLVITEALPITNHISDAVIYAPLYYGRVLEGNPNATLYIYQTWPDLFVNDWVGQIESERVYWEQIADAAGAAHPNAATPLIVPAGPALVELRRRIEAGLVPGITEIRGTIFIDDIHMTLLGNYFIAMVQYATLYKRCPSTMKTDFSGPFGEPDWLVVDPAVRAVFEEVAWQVVSSDPRSGVR
ncbi:hypothetical protein [Acanthopleuribacter pedis]|uniref:Uncharacterized protein n=1 Tax=Acanthopleuribacter pedis TaxID=442870 RepID=A0A8J7U6B9_9BACT|nr:hypothetical protein [Acanthopleuribacter pedis]MBO1320211.1 hypothetical protein [Acanthopleuribacter pedis]